MRHLSFRPLLRTLANGFAALIILAASLAAAQTTTDTASRSSRATAEEETLLALAREGEAAYRDAKYEEAAKAFAELAERAPHDPNVLYNLGTAYAQLGERGLAIWRYLQAQKYEPRDRQIRENLETVGYEPAGLTPLPPLNWLYGSLSGNEWSGLAGGATLLALLLTAAALSARRGTARRSALKSAAWCAGLAAILAWPFAATHYYLNEMTWHGVIVAEGSVARTGPSEQQIETFALPPGTVVRVEERAADGWVKIAFAGGRMGYVEQSRLRTL